MRKRILEYRKRIDKLLEDNDNNVEWEEVLDEHLIQVSFFQHERLIHLIVTLAFAIFMIVSFAMFVMETSITLGILSLLFLILLIPYVAHYYILENEVQKMYYQYDRIIEKIYDKYNKESE